MLSRLKHSRDFWFVVAVVIIMVVLALAGLVPNDAPGQPAAPK